MSETMSEFMSFAYPIKLNIQQTTELSKILPKSKKLYCDFDNVKQTLDKISCHISTLKPLRGYSNKWNTELTKKDILSGIRII